MYVYAYCMYALIIVMYNDVVAVGACLDGWSSYNHQLLFCTTYICTFAYAFDGNWVVLCTSKSDLCTYVRGYVQRGDVWWLHHCCTLRICMVYLPVIDLKVINSISRQLLRVSRMAWLVIFVWRSSTRRSVLQQYIIYR